MRERLSYAPVPGVGLVAMVVPTVIPKRRDDPLVEFTIRVPSFAAHGARVDWQRLCEYGTDSAMLYRAYLAVCTHLDASAHRGHPQMAMIPQRRGRRTEGGPLVPNPRVRFAPPLTSGDLARMIGFHSENRLHRSRAQKAFERLAADGVIDLHREASGEWCVLGVRRETGGVSRSSTG